MVFWWVADVSGKRIRGSATQSARLGQILRSSAEAPGLAATFPAGETLGEIAGLFGGETENTENTFDITIVEASRLY